MQNKVDEGQRLSFPFLLYACLFTALPTCSTSCRSKDNDIAPKRLRGRSYPAASLRASMLFVHRVSFTVLAYAPSYTGVLIFPSLSITIKKEKKKAGHVQCIRSCERGSQRSALSFLFYRRNITASQLLEAPARSSIVLHVVVPACSNRGIPVDTRSNSRDFHARARKTQCTAVV